MRPPPEPTRCWASTWPTWTSPPSGVGCVPKAVPSSGCSGRPGPRSFCPASFPGARPGRCSWPTGSRLTSKPIAVGTALAGSPPHRSQRALLEGAGVVHGRRRGVAVGRPQLHGARRRWNDLPQHAAGADAQLEQRAVDLERQRSWLDLRGPHPGRLQLVVPGVVRKRGELLVHRPPGEGTPRLGRHEGRDRLGSLEGLAELVEKPVVVIPRWHPGSPLSSVVAALSPTRLACRHRLAWSAIRAASAGLRRSFSRHRARVGPMLPTGIPIRLLTSVYDGGGSVTSSAMSCWH